MIDISPMILASALANLSSTESASEVIDIEPWPEPILRGRDIQQDSGHADQWRQADHRCQDTSFDNKGADDELLTKRTLKAERSRSYPQRQWGHHELYPPDDEGIGAMMQVR